MVTLVLIILYRKKPKLHQCAGATVSIHRLFNIQPPPEFHLTQEALKLAEDLGALLKVSVSKVVS